MGMISFIMARFIRFSMLTLFRQENISTVWVLLLLMRTISKYKGWQFYIFHFIFHYIIMIIFFCMVVRAVVRVCYTVVMMWDTWKGLELWHCRLQGDSLNHVVGVHVVKHWRTKTCIYM